VSTLLSRIAELEAETKALKENSRWLARLTESSRKENEHLRQTLSVYAAKQRWISVSERLPEDTERMLTIVYDAFEDTTAISILQHYGDGDWFSWDSGRYVVTHWMPLPESPEVTE
jgi:regulator of replication initiation timing